MNLINSGGGGFDLDSSVIRLFKDHPKMKISGAEIADIIDQTYQESFIKNPERNGNIIEGREIFKRLESFCNKDRDVEINNKIRQDINLMKLERETQSTTQLNKEQEKELKSILRNGGFDEKEMEKQMCQIKLNIALGKLPWDDEKEKTIKEKLWEKYSKDDLESYYKSKGYRSAATNE